LQFVNAAIANQSGVTKLYTVDTDGVETGLASFDRNLVAKQLPLGTKVVEIPVETYTLSSLLMKFKIDKIDLLQLDTEGFDYQILLMLDYNLYRPAIIHFEHRHLTPSDCLACMKLLNGHGCRLHVSGMDTTAIIQRQS
jgi:FkbM family methyltransferase